MSTRPKSIKQNKTQIHRYYEKLHLISKASLKFNVGFRNVVQINL